MQPLVFVLEQGSTALARDVYLHCGWRPSAVFGYSGGVGDWMKANGQQLDTEEVRTFPDGSGTIDDTDNICEVYDNGIILHSNSTWIRADDLHITIMAFPPNEVRVYDATLSSELPIVRSEYGTGGQYAVTDQSGDAPDWISRAGP